MARVKTAQEWAEHFDPENGSYAAEDLVLVDIWMPEDVTSQACDVGLESLTDDDVQRIMEIVERDYTAPQGVNWDRLLDALRCFKEEREAQKDASD